MRSRIKLLLGLVGAAFVLTACGSGDLPQDSLNPQGPFSRDINDLWNLVFWTAVAVFALVAVAMVVSLWRFRERKGDQDRKIRQLHGNTRLEVVWTIIPAVILAVLAVPTVSLLFDIREGPSQNALDINVVGHQWWWEFEYVESGGFFTANELHIPAGREVYLTMTSDDVIHSFWVPALNGKRDAVPGRTSDLRLFADEPTPPGEPIFGQCAEFCGLAHADMRIKVFVHTEEDFVQWAAQQAQPAAIPTEGLAAEGWQTFNRVCTACHAVAGTGAQIRLAPDLTHFGSRSTFGGASFENTTEHLRQWLDNPADLKPMDPDRNDLAATPPRVLGMPDFGLSSSEIDGLIALLQGWE